MHLFEAERTGTDEKGMRTLRGRGNHTRSAIGKTVFFAPRERYNKTRVPCLGYEEERKRYFSAHSRASAELRRLYGELRMDCDAAWIFLMQLSLLDDELFSSIPELYLKEKKSAEESTLLCRDYFMSVLCRGAGGENLSALALDVEDVSVRILCALGNDVAPPSLTDQSIILTRTPLPSYIAEQRAMINGIAVASLTDTTHINELATSLSIPFLHTDTELSESLADKIALIDATKGYLHIDPDLNTLSHFSDEEQLKRNEEKEASEESKNTVKNSDGKKLNFLAELENEAELKRLRTSLVDGIGRFSSEELYLREMQAPDEELLFEEYRRLAEAMPTKPVIIKALKTSGTVHLSSIISGNDNDSHADLYVTQDTTLRTQLRAVMRAAAYGSLEFSLPATKRYSDIFTCATLMDELSRELYEEEREFNPVPLGAFVSDVASALMCDKLLDECDFLIIEKEKLCKSLADSSESISLEDDSICFDALCTIVGNIQKSAQKKKKRLILSLGKDGSLDGLSKELIFRFTYISSPLGTVSSLKKALIEKQKG